MLEMSYPRRYEISIYVIPFDYYHAQGMQGVIFDVDNTLVPHDTPTDGQAVELFERLRAMGMKTCLLLNSKEPRVKPFADLAGSCYIHKTGKPGVRGYEKATELMGADRNHTLFVGDQLFTDVHGANRTGIYSILVRPMDPREEIQIVLKCYLEKPVLYFYRKHARDINQDREQNEIIDGKTRACGLTANPVEHPMPPMMRNFFVQRTGVNLIYAPFKVEEDRVGDAVKGAYALSILGMNVMAPHKQQVMEFLSELDEDARAIGAANTLVRTTAGYKGYNTDGAGLKRALAQTGIRTEGEHCLLIGAGGAAKVIVYVLTKGGAVDIHILNRNEARARELVDCINTLTSSGLAEALSLKGYRKLPVRKDGYLAVQSTSVGIHPHVEDAVTDDPRFYKMIHTGVDTVYTPVKTRFMKMIQEAGGRAVNGLNMSLYQGVIVYELRNPQMRVDSGTIKAAKQMIENYPVREQTGEDRGENLILIGLMGAGKTSVGEYFAARYRMPMIDTDKEIEVAAGMAISDILAARGEGALRRLGTGVLEKLLKQGGRFVISMGGGLPLRAENGMLLKQLGTVVYLDVLPETIMERIGADVSDRSMFHGSDVVGRIISLLEPRKPYCLEASHITVDVNGRDVDDIVEKIHRRIVDKTC